MPTSEIDFDSIKRVVSLSEILAKYVRVPNRTKYRIPCPIHGGDGYNFAVDEEKGLYHCFTNCGGGDVITLFAKLEGLTNIEAARRLSAEYRIRASSGSREFREVLNDTRSWEPKGPLPEIELPESSPLNAYRRFSFEAIGWFDLRLVSTGVLLPCRDVNGRVVGYAIRQVNVEPKYLNSTDFRKSEVLYGLYENLEAIKSQRYAIICEGQFSAIRVWDSGHRNVVATLGATMSPTQAHLLTPYVDRVVVLYDGDPAGVIGASKIKESYSALFKVQVLGLPLGEDPDSGDLKILDEE